MSENYSPKDYLTVIPVLRRELEKEISKEAVGTVSLAVGET